MERQRLFNQIRYLTAFTMIAILLSGVTAFPIETELKWLNEHRHVFPAMFEQWIAKVYHGVKETNASFPFLAYGTDWLAFAHLIIAALFIGVWQDPVRNRWIVDWGLFCCIAVVPLAMISGQVRQIPFFHRLIDCAFGIFGLIPLLIMRRKINQLAAAATNPEQ